MPKIPTFTAQARPTAEAAGVTSNIKIPLTQTVGAALRPLGKAAEDYYIKEKEIEFQVQAGELDADATVEVFNAAEQAELKNTPQEGIDYFNQQFESIQNKYKAKAPNKNVGDLFSINFSKNKSVYVNNILKQTRNNLVTTRVSQVEQKVKSKIAYAISSENDFQFDILAKSIEEDYKGLVNEGIIGEKDLQSYKNNLPKLVEIEQVRFLARTDAAGAAVLLQDINNFKQIQGDDRKKLITEVRQKARFDSEVLKFNNASVINEQLKKQ
ncbi:hypothetical protein [Pelagibacter phage HTVC010P]|uniref:hypothetical protein n=1 Tax=Pelagibacter phage HTVC010P TaxID=1283077 RepID=UPI0002B27252|nr:hypothetical protein I900_gp16 [Pelagibacter phage HTVC010P]AGE60286.1 hypothetical protein [Pelagibacter phage HTVC010P]